VPRGDWQNYGCFDHPLMNNLQSLPIGAGLAAAAAIWMVYSHGKLRGAVILEELVARKEPTHLADGAVKFHYDYVVLEKTVTSDALCAELNKPEWKEAKVNGSILSTLKDGKCHIPVMEAKRTASAAFWMSIQAPLKEFLASLPATLEGMGFIPPIQSTFDNDCAWMYQIQYLSGRAAFYWHQDIRWNTHWDVVIFMYMSDDPIVTEIVCPEKEFVATPGEPGGSKGQPEIARLAGEGTLPIIAPAMKPAQLFVLNNRKVWHRSPYDSNDKGLNSLITVRMKFPALRK